MPIAIPFVDSLAASLYSFFENVIIGIHVFLLKKNASD
jgi:hypothetical protein